MQLKECLLSYLDTAVAADREAAAAVNTFFTNVPARILEVSLDNSHTNKQGITQGESVYKFGVILENDMCFLEFYENRAQGEPSMSLYVDRTKKLITVRGWKVDKKFYLCYKNIGGKVEKAIKME